MIFQGLVARITYKRKIIKGPALEALYSKFSVRAGICLLVWVWSLSKWEGFTDYAKVVTSFALNHNMVVFKLNISVRCSRIPVNVWKVWPFHQSRSVCMVKTSGLDAIKMLFHPDTEVLTKHKPVVLAAFFVRICKRAAECTHNSNS